MHMFTPGLPARTALAPSIYTDCTSDCIWIRIGLDYGRNCCQLLSIAVNCCQLLSIVSDLLKVYVFYYCKLPQLTLPMIPPDCPSFRSVQLHRRLPEPLLFTIFYLVFILLESSTYKSFYKYSFNFASIVSGPYTSSSGLSYNGSNLS